MNEEDKKKRFFLALDDYQRIGDKGQEALVSLFRETQNIFGMVPNWVLEETASAFELKLTFLQAILKRYPSLRGEGGTVDLLICAGPNCNRNGSAALVKAARKLLEEDMELGQKVRLRTAGCFRQCRLGPNCKLNGKLYPGMTPEALKKLLLKLRQ